MKQQVIVYWLIPAEPERELFREIVRILAQQFDAPLFEPHLTLFSSSEDQQMPETILPEIEAKPVRLKIHDIGFSPQFTKTLFVRFVSNRVFDDLVVDLGCSVGLKASSPSDPHLSLLYKEMPAPAKEQLAATIKLPFQEVAFDSVKAMRCISPTTTAADVESWGEIATRSLRA